MPLSPGDPFDRYVIATLLGSGGMGEVYRAHDPRLQRAVALKILHPELAESGSGASSQTHGLARLLREARAAAALEHPNAVAVYDVGEVNGTAYLAMEFIAGRTLRESARDPAVGLGLRVRWLVNVARALAAAHKRGLVHRDIKPENVMLREDGVVKVLDFGIARRIASPVEGDAPTEAAVTASQPGKSGLAGTPAYMAPEQIRARTLDATTDQFSWGVMAYELLAGRLPWSEDADSLQLVAEILGAQPKPPSRVTRLTFEIPRELDAAILRALAKEPRERFASMSDAAAAIEPFAAEPAGTGSSRRSLSSIAESQPSRPASSVRSRPRRIARHLGIWLGMGGALVVASFARCAMRPAAPLATTSPKAFGADPPASSNPEAMAAYVAAVQSTRDAATDVAVRELRRAVELDPGFAPAYLRSALLSASLDERARDDFARATGLRAKLNDHDRELLHAFEPLMGSSPDPRLTAARLEEAIHRAPGDTELLFYLGKARWFDGDWEGAARTFDEALARDPELVLAVRYKGSALGFQGKLHDAAEVYEQCLSRSPEATGCAWDLTRLLGIEGACDEEERIARDQIARHEAVRLMHYRLAETLYARGSPEPAVLAVLQKEWQRWPPDSRPPMEARDRASLEVLRGDFSAAASHATSWARALGDEANEDEETNAFALSMKIATETGRTTEVAALQHDYDARSAAWTVDAFSPDESIAISALSYRAGVIDRGAFVKRRAAWLAGNEGQHGLYEHSSPPHRWFAAYGTSCVTGGDASEALAAFPGSSPSPFLETDSDEPLGEMYVLAGRRDEAIQALSRAARACTALHAPFESTWAAYRLGQILETSDRTGACREYGVVLSRWGHGAPASRTAALAAQRAHALDCSF